MKFNLLPTAAWSPACEDDDRGDLVIASQSVNMHDFRQIYRQHVDRVRAVLYRLVEPHNMDDLTQEVFIKVWKNLPQLETRSYLATWIYRIATNVAYDYYRSRGRMVKTEPLMATCDLAATDKSPDDDTKEMVAHGLARLSFDHRTVIVLHDMQELTIAEIATIIKKPEGTVKSRLSHARAHLGQIFATWEGEKS